MPSETRSCDKLMEGTAAKALDEIARARKRALPHRLKPVPPNTAEWLNKGAPHAELMEAAPHAQRLMNGAPNTARCLMPGGTGFSLCRSSVSSMTEDNHGEGPEQNAKI